LFLAPGDVSGLIEIFDVTIDPAALDGPYVGNTVSMQGGVDSAALDDLADVNFDVQVSSPVTGTPEPSTGIFMSAGAAVAFAIVARNRNGRFRV
jgi:hypothetical protein